MIFFLEVNVSSLLISFFFWSKRFSFKLHFFKNQIQVKYFADYVPYNTNNLLKKKNTPHLSSVWGLYFSLNYLCIYIKIDLTSETTSWDMSLCMAARHIWVIFGSFVPQPIRKGWTTSELFSFNAFKKRYRSSQCLILWRIQCKIWLITLLQSWKFEIYSFITGRSQVKTVDCHSSLPPLPGWHSNPKHLLTHLHPYSGDFFLPNPKWPRRVHLFSKEL